MITMEQNIEQMCVHIMKLRISGVRLRYHVAHDNLTSRRSCLLRKDHKSKACECEGFCIRSYRYPRLDCSEMD